MDGVPTLNIQYPNLGNVLAKGATIKGQEARNVLTQMQIEGYPEERNWLREKRGYVREDRAIAAEERERTAGIATAKEKREAAKHVQELEIGELKKEQMVMKQIRDWLAQIENVADYAKFVEGIIRRGGSPPGKFRDPSTFLNPDGTPNEEMFDQYQKNMILSADDHVAIILEEMKKKEAKPTYDHQTIYGPKGQTKRVAIKKGDTYIPPDGWSLTKPGIEGTKKEYTIAQRIDDARGYYNFKKGTLLGDFGTVKEGKEKEYDKLSEKLAADIRAIKAGKEPSYLKEKEITSKSWRDYQ